MEITKIKKLSGDWYELTLTDEGRMETFKITEELMIESHIFSKKKIDEVTYGRLQSLANYSKCYQQTLNYIAYKMRTEKEIRDYLSKKECEPSDQGKIIEKLKSLRYIDDARYAELYTREQVEFNKKGLLWIKDQLIKKGISIDLIQNATHKIPKESILTNLRELIKKSDGMNKTKPIRKLQESLMRTLLSRGYEMADIRSELLNYTFSEPKGKEERLLKEVQKAYKKLLKKYEGYELKSRLLARFAQKGYDYSDIEQSIDEVMKEET